MYWIRKNEINIDKTYQTLLQVKTTVEEVLDKNLPDIYDKTAFKEKCDNVFELIVNLAVHGQKWAA